MCIKNPRAWGTVYKNGKISPNVWYTKPTKRPKGEKHYTFREQLAMMSEKDLTKLKEDLHLYGKYEVVFDLSAQGKCTKEIAEVTDQSERNVSRVIKQLRKDIECLNNGEPINRPPTVLARHLTHMPMEYLDKLRKQLDLNTTQAMIFTMIAEGKEQKEIGEIIGCTQSTLKRKVKKIHDKMRALGTDL